MATTRIYDRLPSDSGVTFEGFENIKLKSRESVREKLEDFMNYCKSARKPAIRVILGEWGEGKTDAYKRYIKPKAEADGNYAFFVSASTLSNGYEVPSVSKLLESTPLSAVRFLVVLFNCIREECKEARIPDPQNYSDASSYLNDALKNLIGEEKTRRIFIFIDEFEELLLFPQKLKDIISGIKETINGRYTAIDEGGEYEGCVHLIVAATPDAYYRLQTEEDTSLIFGGLGRRAGVIDLPQIRKEEGITFLFELLKYIYNNNLPQPLPFSSFGIFNALFRITQGNPGNLVSLFTRLMNSARVDEKSIKVIDSEHFLKFLEKEYVFVYGGSTACLETETFHRFLKIVEDQKRREIGEKCSLLLRTVVGEFKPFSVDELEENIKYKDIKNLIAIVNDDLRRREGIKRAILKVSPLRPDKTFHDIETVFKEFISEKEDGKYIQIDNYSERLDAFEDRISYFTYEDGNIVRKIYLPSDQHDIMSFFEGIRPRRAIEIGNIISKKLCEDKDYYIASDELLSQIFPTPVPRELEFIINREKRLKLWRDVTRNLAKEYENNMPDALIYVLKRSDVFSIEKIGCEEKEDHIPTCIAKLIIGEMMKINSIFFPVNGDVKSADIEELSHLIEERKPPIHCALLIFTGDITPEAEEKIENKEMGKKGENLILEIRIHPTLVKRIICIYKAKQMPAGEINENLLSSVINKTVRDELNIPGKINSWLKEQEKKGVVVRLRIQSTSNFREFADTLRFFINFMEYEETIDEIFYKNQDLLEYTRYGAKKIGLIPDIQLPKFNKIVEDLLDNGFLVKLREGRYKIQDHPVENRILRILDKETKILQKDLEEFFVLENSRYLNDVFLPILEYKGLIERKDKYYSLTDKNELSLHVENEYARFLEIAQQYQDYGYIYMIKERGDRFISLTKLKSFINELYKQIQGLSGLNERVELQKLSLMKRLLEHFFEELYPLIKKASEKGKSILTDAYSLENEVKSSVDKIREECNKWFKLQFEIESVEEYKRIREALKEIKECLSFADEEIKERIKGFKEEEKKNFFFNKNEEDAYYFNPKLYIMSTSFKKAKDVREEIKKAVEELERHLKTLDEKQERIESALRSKKVGEKYKISYLILGILNQLTKNIIPQAKPFKIEKLELKNLFKHHIQPNIQIINSNLDSLSECIDSLDKLYKTEEEFTNSLEECLSLSDHIRSIFDIGEYVTAAENFGNKVNDIKSKYEKCSEEVRLEEPSPLLKKIKELKKKIDDLKEGLIYGEKEIYLKWEDYVKETKNFTSNIEYIIDTLRKQAQINVREIQIDPKRIEEIKNELDRIRNCVSVNIKEFNLKLSELEQMKNNVRDVLYDTLKNILAKDELRLLEYIVGEIRGKIKKWLSAEEIYQFAKSNLQLDHSKATEALKKLVDLKILKEGITLAF
ncbi:hypothetical protein [Candidatus Methanodesulfokora washburnensis]|uniref:Uncharacterized protein n=1 Tax=Candidatus Methanodesulfokora washburnensis TaxID=2478471 RepID=A0A3R9QSA7_9CREN|nr:hypothetical protein [Candidatus Methanodesulfokores washburnensis]RSN71495.1 hypothetical protein D6D85_15945 [Candidatus Methanodesulfokores washburnensis]